MASSTIGGLTEATALALGDNFEIENEAGNSRRVEIATLDAWMRTRQQPVNPSPAVGRYVQTSLPWGDGATVTAGGASGLIEMFPYLPPHNIDVDRVAVIVDTEQASAEGRVVAYSTDATGRPADRILETTELDLSSDGVKTVDLSPSLELRRGDMIWLGFHHSSTATMSAWARRVLPMLDMGTPQANSLVAIRLFTSFAGGAPSSWSWDVGGLTSSAPTAIWLRAS